MAIYLYDIYPLCVVGSLGGITIVYIISKFVYEKLHLIRKPLILLGQNTLLILCYHHIMWRSMPFVNKLMPGLCLTSTILLNLCVPICLMILHLKIRTVFIENSTT